MDDAPDSVVLAGAGADVAAGAAVPLPDGDVGSGAEVAAGAGEVDPEEGEGPEDPPVPVLGLDSSGVPELLGALGSAGGGSAGVA